MKLPDAAFLRRALALLLWASLGFGTAFAFPGLTGHRNDGYTIEWERDGTKNGSTAHNHRWRSGFGGLNLFRQPYSAFSCWDNLTYRLDTAGSFDQGHCFIDEGNLANVPEYFFEANVPAAARARLRDAFNAWGAVTSDSSNRATGIRFRETTVAGNAEIRVGFANLVDDQSCGGQWNFGTRTLTFDNAFDAGHGQWNFARNPAGIGADDWHFYSVALHEVGHAVGLAHQNDWNADVMAPSVGEPVNFDCGGAFSDGRTGAYFAGVDGNSIVAVQDLYSQPIPNPLIVRVSCVPSEEGGPDQECEANILSGVGPYTYRWDDGTRSSTWFGECDPGPSPRVEVEDSRGAFVVARGTCSNDV